MASRTASCWSPSTDPSCCRSAALSTTTSSWRSATRSGSRFASPLPNAPALEPAARERWIDIYTELSTGRPGLTGATTARAEAHVVRLALIYALLDYSEQICLEHLEAALAVWRYSAASAAWIFGDSLGDPTADEIWAAAKERPAGLTRTEVSDMFSRFVARHKTAVLFPARYVPAGEVVPAITAIGAWVLPVPAT